MENWIKLLKNNVFSRKIDSKVLYYDQLSPLSYFLHSERASAQHSFAASFTCQSRWT